MRTSPDADRPVPATTWREPPRPAPWPPARATWAAAVLAGALDVALTLYGLGLGFAEANPVAAVVVGAVGPVPALVGLKLLALGVVALGARALPTGLGPTAPATLAVVWALAALYNVSVLL